MYVDQTRGNFSKIREFLNTIEILEYNSIVDDIKEYVDSGSKIWISPESSYYIYSTITNKVFFLKLCLFNILTIYYEPYRQI